MGNGEPHLIWSFIDICKFGLTVIFIVTESSLFLHRTSFQQGPLFTPFLPVVSVSKPNGCLLVSPAYESEEMNK